MKIPKLMVCSNPHFEGEKSISPEKETNKLDPFTGRLSFPFWFVDSKMSIAWWNWIISCCKNWNVHEKYFFSAWSITVFQHKNWDSPPHPLSLSPFENPDGNVIYCRLPFLVSCCHRPLASPFGILLEGKTMRLQHSSRPWGGGQINHFQLTAWIGILR